MKQFTLTSRRMLWELLKKEESYREMQKVLDKSLSGISKEINRNGGRQKYNPYRAEQRA